MLLSTFAKLANQWGRNGGLSTQLAGLGTAQAIRDAYSGVAAAGGLIATMTSPGYDGRTFQAVRVAEAPYFAVRLVIRNLESTGYTIGSACVAPSSTPYSTGTTPAPNPTGAWAPVTWNNGATSVSIPAALGTNRPSITYSDWIYISSVARSDGSGYAQPLIYLRAYNATGPKSGLIGSTANPNQGGRANWGVASALNRGRIFLTSSASGDFSSSNQSGMTDDGGNYSTFVYEFECMHAVPTLSVTAVGDSIMQGDGASIVHAGYAFRACTDVSMVTKPVVFQNQGWSNMTTANFAARLADLFAAGARPSVVIFPCWSPNDAVANSNVVTQSIIDQAWANAMRMLSLCRQHGAVPIMVGPTPRSYSGSSETLRQALVARFRAFAASKNAAFYALDADGILASTPGGNSMGALSSDQLHPNDAGNDALNNGLNGYAGLKAILTTIAGTYFR